MPGVPTNICRAWRRGGDMARMASSAYAQQYRMASLGGRMTSYGGVALKAATAARRGEQHHHLFISSRLPAGISPPLRFTRTTGFSFTTWTFYCGV